MEGVGRFYVKSVLSEKPYLRARVQRFFDYIEDPALLASLEKQILDEVRYSVKIMKLLYPQNNYTLNDLVIRNRPLIESPDRRSVFIETPKRALRRRSQFSFAVMDMLKTDAVTKLVFLQEPILERRNAKILKVLGELVKRGLVRSDRLVALKSEAVGDTADIDNSYTLSSWLPASDGSGELRMSPSLMD
ncbi:unnamed protein product [Sphagnum jensenii]|uniref:Uncharacterized protein n=1 Tax=Sphagnum jensenii TaxID=128206 RepID=A0ABP0VDA2_9BRYO